MGTRNDTRSYPFSLSARIADHRSVRSWAVMSSIRVARVHTCPDGSMIPRDPVAQNDSAQEPGPAPRRYRSLHRPIHVGYINKDHDWRTPVGFGPRLGSVGHSPSIMIIAGPMVINACATVPSGPGLRFSSTAPRTRVQKATAAAGSRHTNLGMTTDESSGTPWTPPEICFSESRRTSIPASGLSISASPPPWTPEAETSALPPNSGRFCVQTHPALAVP